MDSLCRMKFKDFVTLQRGFDLPRKEMAEGPYPVVGSTSVIGHHNEWKAKGPSVVTGRSGSLGHVQYIRDKCWPHNTALWVKDFKGNYPRYVYYILQTMNLNRFNSGVGVPTLNRNDLDTLEITIHPVAIQPKVASILSAYDDLIENNTRRIKILEQIAQVVYREWFVHLHFPGHQESKLIHTPPGNIPQSWKVRNLFDVSEVTYGFAFKSKHFTSEPHGKPVIRIRDIKTNGTTTYTHEKADEKYLIRNGDLLVGMDGEFHMGKWAGGEAYLNQRVVRLRPKEGISSYFLFLSLEEPIHHFDSIIVGTTVAHLSDKDLRSINLVVPDGSLLIKIAEVFDPIFELETDLHQKNVKLRHMRDVLLPKLISGAVDVSELAIKTGVDEL